MLRLLAFLLVFGNIVLFALTGGWLDGGAATTDAAGESRQPLSPDRIRIVGRGDPPPLPEPVAQCLAWPELSAAQVAELERVATNGKGLRLQREQTRAAVLRHRVQIPPLTGGKAAAEKKAAELKTLGVKSFRLEREGDSDRWAITFGVFETEAQAGEALETLKKLGVRSAAASVLEEAPAQYRVQLTGTASALAPLRRNERLPEAAECPSEAKAGNGLATGGKP